LVVLPPPRTTATSITSGAPSPIGGPSRWEPIERLEAFEEREKGDKSDRTGIFRDSLVNNIKELVNIIPALNLTETPEIEAMRVKLLRQLCASPPEELRQSPLVRQHVLDRANAILKEVSEFLA
jgi:hypothetical protein